MRADHEIPKSVETNAGQSHEHTRVLQVVCFQIVGARVIFDECVAVGERHHHNQRVRFGGLVGIDAHEHLPVDLQSGLAPCSCYLYVWKGAADSLDGCERVPAAFIADLLAR